jgi:hypothetical protein
VEGRQRQRERERESLNAITDDELQMTKVFPQHNRWGNSRQLVDLAEGFSPLVK